MSSTTHQHLHPPHQPAAGFMKLFPVSRDESGASPQLVFTAQTLSINYQKWTLTSWGVVVADGF